MIIFIFHNYIHHGIAYQHSVDCIYTAMSVLYGYDNISTSICTEVFVLIQFSLK